MRYLTNFEIELGLDEEKTFLFDKRRVHNWYTTYEKDLDVSWLEPIPEEPKVIGWEYINRSLLEYDGKKKLTIISMNEILYRLATYLKSKEFYKEIIAKANDKKRERWNKPDNTKLIQGLIVLVNEVREDLIKLNLKDQINFLDERLKNVL